MIQPPYLKRDDTVYIISPAGQIAGCLIDSAARQLQQWGFFVKIGEYVTASYSGFAGSDEQRLHDLQTAINDTDTAAIFCARGGYGCSRIVDNADFSPLLAQPKWVIGFSDITMLHARLQRLELQSIHGPMCKSFLNNHECTKSTAALRQALCGELQYYEIPAHRMNRRGMARGILRGGNLSLIACLAATPDDIVPDNTILFLEDTGEYAYHIDRMMNNLQRSGKLQKLAGVIVGYFTDIKTAAVMPDHTAYGIISDYLTPLNIPVCYGFSGGHSEPNHALYLGREVTLDVRNDVSLIRFS